MTLSVVIPTYRRPNELRCCLASVAAQTFIPDEVLIVDDADLKHEFINELTEMMGRVGCRLVYHRKNHDLVRRGLSESRNLAADLVSGDFVLLDDDVELESGCLKALVTAWREEDDGRTVAVSGSIRNNRQKPWAERFYDWLFGLVSPHVWDVNEIGFQVWDDHFPNRARGHYGHGGFCLVSRKYARKLRFPAFQSGRPGLEDVHFFLQAKRAGLSVVFEPRAGCVHRKSGGGRDRAYEEGFREGFNRRVIFRDLCAHDWVTRLRFVWANVGWAMRQFVAGHFSKGAGMIVGALSYREKA